jgi:hypothetical protein
MGEDNRWDQIVRYWWSKAEESLAAAARELDAGSLAFAMNRVYYAAFYAVSAALLNRNLSFKKHSGVRSTFHRAFVKTGLVETSWGKFYDRLFEDRQEGDYIALIEFDGDYVNDSLVRCREFIANLKPFISVLK